MMPEQESQPPEEEDPTAAARAIADMISEFRAEVMDKIRTDVEDELAELEAKDYDPARGRGRGHHWMKEG